MLCSRFDSKLEIYFISDINKIKYRQTTFHHDLMRRDSTIRRILTFYSVLYNPVTKPNIRPGEGTQEEEETVQCNNWYQHTETHAVAVTRQRLWWCWSVEQCGGRNESSTAQLLQHPIIHLISPHQRSVTSLHCLCEIQFKHNSSLWPMTRPVSALELWQ